MINIGYFSNQFSDPKGHGIKRYANHLFISLKKLDKNLTLYPISASYKGNKYQHNKLISKTGLQVLPLGRILTPISWIFFNHPKIENQINCNIDIVHALSLSYKIATNKPYIVTIHDIGPLTHRHFFTFKDHMFMKSSLKQAIFKAKAIICVSKATADSVEKYAKKRYNICLKERLHIIYEGVDKSFFNPPVTKDITDFHLVKPFTNKPFILTVGQLSPRKNLKSVLDAFKNIKDKLPELQLIAVGGNGWDYKEINDYVNLLDLNESVHFLGYVSENLLRFLYREARVFVYPSLFEGFGLTVLEAMASGCPVISSNSTSLPEVCGNAALLVDPTDINLLSTQILKVCQDNDLRKELILKGENRAKKFTWEETACNTFDLYNKISQ